MPRSSTKARSLQGRLAAATRWGSPERDAVAAELAAEKISQYIAKTVAAAPPLTTEQRERLAALLTVPDARRGAA